MRLDTNSSLILKEIVLITNCGLVIINCQSISQITNLNWRLLIFVDFSITFSLNSLKKIRPLHYTFCHLGPIFLNWF